MFSSLILILLTQLAVSHWAQPVPDSSHMVQTSCPTWRKSASQKLYFISTMTLALITLPKTPSHLRRGGKTHKETSTEPKPEWIPAQHHGHMTPGKSTALSALQRLAGLAEKPSGRVDVEHAGMWRHPVCKGHAGVGAVTQEMVLREQCFLTWHLSVQKDLIAILKITAVKLSWKLLKKNKTAKSQLCQETDCLCIWWETSVAAACSITVLQPSGIGGQRRT